MDDCIAGVVGLLVSGRYKDLERLSGGVRLSAQDLAQAVVEYGRTLAMPPDVGHAADVVEVVGAHRPTWSAWVPLFTREEGRSDLGLELTLTQDSAGGYKVQIENVRVP